MNSQVGLEGLKKYDIVTNETPEYQCRVDIMEYERAFEGLLTRNNNNYYQCVCIMFETKHAFNLDS